MKKNNNICARLIRQYKHSLFPVRGSHKTPLLGGSPPRIRPGTLFLFIGGFIVIWIILEVQVGGLANVAGQMQERIAFQDQTLAKMGDEMTSADATILSLRQRLNISVKRLEMESQFTKDELMSLRDGLTDFLKETSRSGESVNNKLGVLEKQLNSTADRLVNNLEDVYRLKESLSRYNSKPEKLYEATLLPSVRLRTKGNVGGGVIIYSQAYSRDEYQTYILTAYHVVKGMVCATGDTPDDERCAPPNGGSAKPVFQDKKSTAEVMVDIYRPDFSGLDEFKAELVATDEAKDMAILHLKTTRKFQHTAKFASRDGIAQIKVFTPVYAVGCPLGYEPLPTGGEIASLSKKMNNEKFWVMNAPTIFGNSGGGIFLADTYELIGISSMVCVYNQVIPTPVTHLGLMVPADNILKWLDSKGLEFLYNPRINPVPVEGLIANPIGE